MNVLDHLIIFLPGPRAIDVLFPGPAGLILDAGTRHLGQGTRNRRALLADCYLELVWIESPVHARASGLRFQQRCEGNACPFGVVFRGRAPGVPGFLDYTVPAGPTLKILDDPALPFVGVFDDVDDDRSRTPRQLQPGHRNQHALQHAEISTSTTPTNIAIPRITFVRGEPKLTLTLTGVPSPLRLATPSNPRPENWQWT
jgi:Glyoxalase-like domain